MIDLFNSFGSKEDSLTYLYRIFGSVNGVIPNVQGGPEALITILSTMFKTFNGVILVVGAFIILYVTVIGVMKTAHEGEFLGKEWNNIWIPIRMVLGVAALIPSGSGYSAIQTVMMWFIIQGVGAADMLWNTALGYSDVMGSPYAQVSVPTTNTETEFQSLFQGLACYKSAIQTYDNPYGKDAQTGGYFCQVNGSKSICETANFNPSVDTLKSTYIYKLGPNNECGALTYCDYNTSCSKDLNAQECLACNSQIEALAEIIPSFASIADKLVQTDYEYQKYYVDSTPPISEVFNFKPPTAPSWIQDYCSGENISKCYGGNDGGLLSPAPGESSAPYNVISQAYWPYSISPSVGGENFIQTAVNYYTDRMADALTSYIAAEGQGKLEDKVLNEAKKYGWMRAGAYFLYLSSMNNESQSLALPTLQMTESMSSDMDTYRNNYDAAEDLMDIAAGVASGENGAPPQPDTYKISNKKAKKINKMMKLVSKATKDVNKAFKKNLGGGDTNPIIAIQAVGQLLLIIAEAAFLALLIIAFVGGIASSVTALVLGTGLPENPVSGGFSMVFLIIGPLIVLFFGALVSYGALLAVYLPLIPFIIFTMGAIGWLISVIEAMVAGPLVALVLLLPGGHDLLGRAETGLGFLFTVFLRPSLMIFGLVGAMMLSSVVLFMINEPFLFIFNSLKPYDPLSLVFFLAAYISLIIVALNKAFSVIHVIPEQVMRWIGLQGERGGEEAAEVKHELTGAATSTRGAAAEGRKEAGGALAKEKPKKPTKPGIEKK